MSDLFHDADQPGSPFESAVLDQLKAAGPNGLAASKLAPARAAAEQAEQKRVLKSLEAAGKVQSLRQGKVTRYWLAGAMPPQVTPEEKADEVLRRVLPEQRRERLLTLARIRDELLKGLGIKDAAIRTCLRVLEQELLLVKFTDGAKTYYAYAPALRAMLGEAPPVPAAAPVAKAPESQPHAMPVAPVQAAPYSSPPPTRTMRPSEAPLPVTNQRVIEAYRSVRMQRRLPDVEIARLGEVLHCTVDELKPVVIRLCDQGIFIPGKGDWSFATPAARAAAVLIQGEPHLFVRMKD